MTPREFGFVCLKLASTVVLGILIYLYVLPFALQTSWAASIKLRGDAGFCSWYRILRFHPDLDRFAELFDDATESIEAVGDGDRDPRQITYQGRTFWIRDDAFPANSIGYLFAEHAWLAETNSREMVQEGDVVLDVGAHVGVFTAKALDLGAGQVIAVEPDPANVECLRRNFAKEIASGRVAVLAEAAWNKSETLTFHLGESSAWNSLVHHDRGKRVLEVAARPLDEMVRELGLETVDYIKVDVEGAEAEVLEGAVGTLSAYQPTVMVDTDRGSEGWTRAPEILRGAREGYEAVCGPCQVSEPERDRIVPHVMFYR